MKVRILSISSTLIFCVMLLLMVKYPIRSLPTTICLGERSLGQIRRFCCIGPWGLLWSIDYWHSLSDVRTCTTTHSRLPRSEERVYAASSCFGAILRQNFTGLMTVLILCMLFPWSGCLSLFRLLLFSFRWLRSFGEYVSYGGPLRIVGSCASLLASVVVFRRSAPFIS